MTDDSFEHLKQCAPTKPVIKRGGVRCGMKSWKKNVIAGLITLWLGNAYMAGLAFKQAMPALNWKGQVYIGLTWPVAMACHYTGDHCTVVPPMRYARYLFTFGDEQ